MQRLPPGASQLAILSLSLTGESRVEATSSLRVSLPDFV